MVAIGAPLWRVSPTIFVYNMRRREIMVQIVYTSRAGRALAEALHRGGSRFSNRPVFTVNFRTWSSHYSTLGTVAQPRRRELGGGRGQQKRVSLLLLLLFLLLCLLILLVFVRFGDFDGLLPLNVVQPLPLLRVSVCGGG